MLSTLCCGLGSLLGSLCRSRSNLQTNQYCPLSAKGHAGMSGVIHNGKNDGNDIEVTYWTEKAAERLPFPVQCTEGPDTYQLYFPRLSARETASGEITAGSLTALNGSRGSRCVLGGRHNKELDKCPICEIDEERLKSWRAVYGDATAPEGLIQSTAVNERKTHSGRDLYKVKVNVEVIPVCEEE